LRQDEPFEGEGWTLRGTELVVRNRDREQAVNFADLSAVDIFDQHLCAWQRGSDEPVLRIPVTSANTRVLKRLLAERIPASAAADTSGNDLGRILFERKPDRSTTICLWILPILAIVDIAGTAATVAFLARGNDAVAALTVGSVLFALFLLIWVLVIYQHVEFRVCEHGVRRRWLYWSRQLRYEDMNSFTYSAVKQYVKGAYAGTSFVLTFGAEVDGRAKPLTYSKTLQNVDLELEKLRERVSDIIANHMQAEFNSERSVIWTDSLRFLPEGLEYRAQSFFGRKAPILIPYSQIFGYDADQGVFHLWVHGQTKPVAKEKVSKLNFFPGYHLLARLLTTRPAATETAAAQ
jgi:hypothetical protein